MKREEKLKKAIAIAVAYYIEKEKATATSFEHIKGPDINWCLAGKAIQINMKLMIQQRGSVARPRNMFIKEESQFFN